MAMVIPHRLAHGRWLSAASLVHLACHIDMSISWATPSTLVCGASTVHQFGGNLGGIDWRLNVTCNLSVTPAKSLFLMLDVTVLVPVGTQLHGRLDLPHWPHCQLAPDLELGLPHWCYSLFTGWYLASTAGLPRWCSNTVTWPYSLTAKLPSCHQWPRLRPK